MSNFSTLGLKTESSLLDCFQKKIVAVLSSTTANFLFLVE